MIGADRLAARIQALVRELTTTSPAPRGLAHLGLEHRSGTRLEVLAGLSSRGIFRKYERVLVPDGALGAPARWLAAHLGCEVTTTAPPAVARACAVLTDRTPVRGQVQSVAAAPTALPFAAASFTHVWLVEVTLGVHATVVLREMHRVLRPGGFLAIQAICPPAEAGQAAAVAATGFVDIDVHDVTAEAVEQAPVVLAARARLAGLAADPGELRVFVRERAHLIEGVSAGTRRVVQTIARRP